MTAHDAVRDRLAELTPFRSCTKREIGMIASLATQIDVPSGRVLTEAGQTGNEFAFIVSGTATVTHAGTEVAVLSAGDHYGEMALLDDGPRTATITATTPMTLAVVGRRDFDELVERVPAVARSIMVGLAKRVRELDQLDPGS